MNQILTEPLAWWPMARNRMARAGIGEQARHVLTLLLTETPPIHDGATLAARIGLNERTLWTQFRRAGLASPSQWVHEARYVRLAHLLDDQRMSIADASHILRMSAPQALCRMVRTDTGMTATEWRRVVTGSIALDSFVTLVEESADEWWRWESPIRGRPG